MYEIQIASCNAWKCHLHLVRVSWSCEAMQNRSNNDRHSSDLTTRHSTTLSGERRLLWVLIIAWCLYNRMLPVASY